MRLGMKFLLGLGVLCWTCVVYAIEEPPFFQSNDAYGQNGENDPFLSLGQGLAQTLRNSRFPVAEVLRLEHEAFLALPMLGRPVEESIEILMRGTGRSQEESIALMRTNASLIEEIYRNYRNPDNPMYEEIINSQAERYRITKEKIASWGEMINNRPAS